MSYSTIDFEIPRERVCAPARRRSRSQKSAVRLRWDRLAVLGAALGLWVPIIVVIRSLV